MKTLFQQARHEVLVRCQAEYDFGLSTADFVAELAGANIDSGLWDGLDIIQAHRPLPRNFCPDGVTGRSRAHVFRTLNAHLQFSLPHADEHAVVEALDPETLELVIQRVEPYFEARAQRSSST